MRRVAWRKARSDVRANKTQTILFIVVVAIAAAMVTLASAAQRAASDPWKRTFEASKGYHITFFADTRDELPALRGIGGVIGRVGPYRHAYFLDARLDGRAQGVSFAERPATMGPIGRPVVIQGRWMSPGGTDEIVLDRNLARDVGIRVGQTLAVSFGSRTTRFKVVGLAFDPSVPPYPVNSPAESFVLPETLSRLAPTDVVWEMGIRLRNPDAAGAVLGAIRAASPIGERWDAETWTDVSNNVAGDVVLSQIFLTLFALFALVVVALVLGNMASGTVLSQFREIGVLKALGTTPRGVIGVYLAIMSGLGLVAATIGAALGVLVSPFLASQAAQVLRATEAPGLGILGLAIIVLGVAAFVGLVVLVPALRAGRVSTVEALTTGFSSPATRPSRMVRVARRLRIPPAGVAGVKDAFARRGRAVLTISALLLGVITMTFVAGLVATLQAAIKDPTTLGFDPGDIRVVRGDVSDSRFREILDANPSVVAYLRLAHVESELPSSGTAVTLRAVEGNLRRLPFPIHQGRMFETPGEALASQQLVRATGIRVGDRVSARAVGRDVQFRIVGIYPDDEGSSLLASMATARQIDAAVQPNEYLIKAKPGTDLEGLVAELQRRTGNDLDWTNIQQHVREVLLPIGAIMILLNLALLVIAGANTLATTMMAVRERVRDLAILKAIGMTPRQVTRSVMAGVAALAIVAAAIGIPLGMWATHQLVNYVATQQGAGPGLGRPPAPLALALLVPVTIGVALLGSWRPARRAAKLSVAEALHYE